MPAGEDRSYSGNAVPTTLTANISNVVTSIPIAASTGWPDGTGGPFFVYIDSEVIKCTSRTGLTLNVQTSPVTGRGWDGTSAASHLTGATVQHVFTATDAEDANEHISDTSLDHHTQYLTVARHDLSARHGFGILPTVGTPSTSVVGDTAVSGSSNNVARVDHRHAREVFGSPVTSGPTNAPGSAVSVARSDHVHAGGIPILSSTTRPASPIVGQAIIESDTHRLVEWTGTAWRRGPGFSQSGRTWAAVGRANLYSVPSGGVSSYVLPWDTEVADSDGFMPVPDGTTTTTLTLPNTETTGFYAIGAMVIWATAPATRAYIEIVHFDGTNLYQHRASCTNETHASISALTSLSTGHTIQLGMYQNSGAAINIGYAHLNLVRLVT